jgi:hypothetical protein
MGGHKHGLNNYIDTKAKCRRHLKKDFAAGDYLSLKIGNTVRQIGIVEPAL